MAVKSLYFKNVTVNGALSLQDGGTAPTGALTTTGWTMAKLATPQHSIMAVGTKKASGTFAAADALATPTFTAGSCWRSEQPFNGTFAATNFSMAFRIRAGTASSQTGAVKVRLWKSTNADGTGATQLTSTVLNGTTTAALSTTVSATSTVTWTSDAVPHTFTNEYLWVQCEWSIVATSGSNNGDAVFYVESAGVITTPNFVNAYRLTADKGTYTVTGRNADVDFDRQLNAAKGSYSINGNDVGVPIYTPWTTSHTDLTTVQLSEDTSTGPHYVTRSYTFIVGDSYQFSIDYKPNGPNPRGIYLIANLPYGPNGSSFSITGSNTGIETGSNFTSGYWTLNQHSITSTANGYFKALVRGTYIEPDQVSRTGDLQIYLYSTSNSYTGDGNSGFAFENYKGLHYTRFDAAQGSYGITGNDVEFSKVVAPKILDAECGNYFIYTAETELKYVRSSFEIKGVYAITGQAATLRYNRCLIAAQGAYAVAGRVATLCFGHKFAAAQGAYSYSGKDAILRYIPAADVAVSIPYAITGWSVTLTKTYLPLFAQGAGGTSYDEIVQRDGQNIAQRDGQIITANQLIVVAGYSYSGKAATLQTNRKLVAAQGAYSVVGKAATLQTNRKLVAAQGAYSVVGKAATLTAIRKFSAAQGAYAVTGKDPILRYTSSTNVAVSIPYGVTGFAAKLTATHNPLIAAQGVYSVTGRPAVRGYSVIFTQGSYAISGKTATLRYGRIALAAASGAYASSGRAATLTQGRRLIASQGAYSVTGRPATLSHSYTLLLAKGSYAITGRIALRAYGLSLAQGSYAVAGKIVTTRVQRSLASAKGSYAVIGNLGDLRKVGSYSFDLQYGSFAITGNAAKLVRTVKFLSNRGSYTSTGNAAGLKRGLKLNATIGSYSLDGQAVAFQKNYKFNAAKGTYVSIGNTSTKIHEHNLIALSRAYIVTGQSVGSKRRYQSAVASGVYSISETDADLFEIKHGSLASERGRITLSGNPVTFLLTNSRSDSYGIVGSPVTFIRTFHKYNVDIQPEHGTKPTLVPQTTTTVGNLEHEHFTPVTLIKSEKVSVGNAETLPSISVKKVFG